MTLWYIYDRCIVLILSWPRRVHITHFIIPFYIHIIYNNTSAYILFSKIFISLCNRTKKKIIKQFCEGEINESCTYNVYNKIWFKAEYIITCCSQRMGWFGKECWRHTGVGGQKRGWGWGFWWSQQRFSSSCKRSGGRVWWWLRS